MDAIHWFGVVPILGLATLAVVLLSRPSRARVIEAVAVVAVGTSYFLVYSYWGANECWDRANGDCATLQPLMSVAFAIAWTTLLASAILGVRRHLHH